MQHIRKVLLSLTLAAQCGSAIAASDTDAGLGFVLGATAEFGGDHIGEVIFTNGETQSIKSGQGVGLHAGGHYRFANSPFDLGATVGFKYVTTAADNADIKLTRTVLELLGTYFINDDWWLSAGPVLHQNIKLDFDGFAPNVKFDDASGVTLKAGWRWIGVQYTNIKYEAAAPHTGEVDANNFGVVLVGRF